MNPCIMLSFNEGDNSSKCIDEALESFFDTETHIAICSGSRLFSLIGHPSHPRRAERNPKIHNATVATPPSHANLGYVSIFLRAFFQVSTNLSLKR